MTPGDPCRVCGGPEPLVADPFGLAPQTVQVAAYAQALPRFRHTLGSTDENPVRDWICLDCQAKAARAAGIAA